MKKRTKLSILGISVLAGALLLTGCTASFCSSDDKAHILYALDYGVCDYYSAEDRPTDNEGNPLGEKVFADNPNLYYVVKMPTDSASGIGKATADAEKAGLKTPTLNYYLKWMKSFCLIVYQCKMLVDKPLHMMIYSKLWIITDIQSLVVNIYGKDMIY